MSDILLIAWWINTVCGVVATSYVLWDTYLDWDDMVNDFHVAGWFPVTLALVISVIFWLPLLIIVRWGGK